MFGQSNECMEKITIRYSDSNCEDDINALLKSDRKYQNLLIGFKECCIKELGVEVNIRAILKTFSKSILKFETSHDFQRICELPKLKELKYINYSYGWHFNKKSTNYFCSNGLFATCLNVTKLEVKCNGINDRYMKILGEAIKNMRKLKSLALDQIDFLKNVGPEDCKFRLERFESRSSNEMSEISDFLKCHQSTLKVIKFTSLYSEDVPFIFSQCPKLHTLHVYISLSRDKNLEIPENSTIKNLYISGSIYNHEEQEKIAEIFTKLKNLQHIRLHMLYSRYIPTLFACKSLTSVKYEKFSYDVTEDQKNSLISNENIKFIQCPFIY
jgi:hypothetical protein